MGAYPGPPSGMHVAGSVGSGGHSQSAGGYAVAPLSTGDFNTPHGGRFVGYSAPIFVDGSIGGGGRVLPVFNDSGSMAPYPMHPAGNSLPLHGQYVNPLQQSQGYGPPPTNAQRPPAQEHSFPRGSRIP